MLCSGASVSGIRRDGAGSKGHKENQEEGRTTRIVHTSEEDLANATDMSKEE